MFLVTNFIRNTFLKALNWVNSSTLLDLKCFEIFKMFSIVQNILKINYVVHSISFQTFFVQIFKIVLDSWKFTMLLLYILWDDRPIFMISGSNEQLHRNWNTQLVNFKNVIWTSGHFRRTICNKNSVLNLEKMSQKPMECFRLLLEHLAWIEHQFLSGIRDLRKAGSLCRGFKGVREEIQIGSVAFPQGQCTSPQLHPCHRLFDQDGHQHSCSPSL